MTYGTLNVDSVVNSDGVTSGGLYGFKNRIINGAMMIDQRNAGASVTPVAGQYTLDRFTSDLSQSSKYTVQQNAGSVTPPAGFTNYLGVTVGASANVTVGAGDYFAITQYIEGFNIADLAWGTANAQTVTLSFKVYSSLTGTFGGALTNSASNYNYPFSYSIPVANTWTTISVTIAGPTSGTWVTNSGIGIAINFSIGMGSTRSGTAGSWQAANLHSATGCVNLIATNSATFYITGVQLEKGSTATSFDYRPYGTELALCQRYFELVGGMGEAAQSLFYDGYANSAGINCIVTYPFKATKRATPTMALVGTITRSNTSSVTLNPFSNNVVMLGVSSAAGRCYWYNDASSYVTASAEL